MPVSMSVFVFVDYDRVRTLPSAARSAKAETRAGETHTDDTVRGGESQEQGRPLLMLLVVSIQLNLLLLQWW